jgi:large subunit ribosomal protein L22
MKEARAVGNYIRVSPRKARLVVDLIRGLTVEEALSALDLCRKRAARTVGKVLKSAMANAVSQGKMSPEAIVVHKTYVDEGPTLRRYRARAMGRATLIRKRTSRITICLREQEGKQPETGKTAEAKAARRGAGSRGRKGKKSGK